MFKFYEKKLFGNFRLELFVNDEKFMLYEMVRSKVVKLVGGLTREGEWVGGFVGLWVCLW
jgi:hypothetical protein